MTVPFLILILDKPSSWPAVLLWIILLFSAAAGLPRAFVHEEETQTATALRLAATPSALFCGKLLYGLTLTLALLGGLAASTIAVDILPVFKSPAVQVLTFYGGMPAASIEKNITSPVCSWTITVSRFARAIIARCQLCSATAFPPPPAPRSRSTTRARTWTRWWQDCTRYGRCFAHE